MNKLWNKTGGLDPIVEAFTIGRDPEFDLLLAPYDIQGSMAHAKMLCQVGLLTKDELQQLLPVLERLYRQAVAGELVIEEGVEDIHSQIEKWLTEELGDVGKKIHTARSRNDQVLVDIKLFLRDQVKELAERVAELFASWQTLSEKHKEVLLPGYTHFQVAMPSSFGLWFGAYAESLVDDLIQLEAAYRVVNKNPLGSGAGFGSTFPIDRKMTTDLLGFESMHYNVVYAQMSRGKTERILSQAMASIAATLGKFAMDVCLYMGQNMGFISFPAHLTTGSSIMPHKKNPDVFELIRSRCNAIQALPNQMAMMTTNLPSGYHRDMQLLKESLFPAIQDLKDCCRVAVHVLQEIQVNKNILDDEKYSYLYSVEVVNELVREGKSFREAYCQVADAIAEGKFEANKNLHYTHEGSMGNLCNDQIKQRFEEVMGRLRL
jgi:argininosuccinate lyase